MALKGRLEDFSLLEIINLIKNGKKSGTLHIDEGQRQGAIFFRKGEVIYAFIDKEDVGKRLVNCKLISESTLKYIDKYKEEKENKSEDIVEVLISQNFITETKLKNFIESQSKEVLYTIIGWIEGDFDFNTTGEGFGKDILKPIDINDVIEEAKQKLKDWKKIQEVIPDSLSIIHLAPSGVKEKDKVTLSAQEWKIVAEVDGRRSVADISDINEMDKFSVSEIVYNLAKKGLVTIDHSVVDSEKKEKEATVPTGKQEEKETVTEKTQQKEEVLTKTPVENNVAVGEDIEKTLEDIEEPEEDTEFEEVSDYEIAEQEEAEKESSQQKKLKEIEEKFKGKKDIKSMSFALGELSTLNKEEKKKKKGKSKKKEDKKKTEVKKQKGQTLKKGKESRSENKKKDTDSAKTINKFFRNLKKK